MKKILLLGLMGLMGLTGLRAQGQMIIDMWNMTTGVDTTLWYDISGVDSVIITAGDKTSAQSGLVNIGFPFTLGVSTYSQFSTNINGTVRLGSTPVPASGGYSNALNQNNGPKIEPFGYLGRFDNNCYTRMALLGTAGHRVLVVETRMKDYYNGGEPLYLSFQVQMFEAGGLRVVYGEADSGAVYTTTPARLQNGVSAGVSSSNKDIIFIDFATHEAVRLNASCSLHNAAAAWPEKGRWYNLFYDSTLCPYPPAISTTGNNPADITLTCANGVSDLHILIPAVGIDTVWSATESYLSLGGVFNPTTTYNGTVQSICANGRTSYRTRAFSFSTGCGVVHYLPWSADFQTADATNCWDATRYTATGNRWRHANYNMSCAGGGLQTYDEWLVSPAFVLPDSDGITLQWDYKTTLINGIAPTVDVRVALCAADGTVDSTAWVTLRTINTHMSSYTTLYNSLDAYRGQRIKVAYVRYGVGGGTAYLDNFSVNLHPIPSMTLEAPTYTRVGDTTVFAANMIAGCERDIVWTWHSTLMDSTFIGSNEAHMVYSVPGIDTVTVILSNNYGSDTATAVVWVADCHTVASFPWVEGFSSYDYLACWIVNGWQMSTNCLGYDEDGNSRIYWNLASSNTEGSYMLSPAITLPSTGMHNMKLWVEGSRPMMVRLSSTASTDTADYNDTLLVVNSNSTPIDMWWHMVDLEPYAGQTVRIGFFKMAGGQSFINEIKIDYDTLPKLFAIDGQSRTMVDSSTLFTVSLRRGSTDGLHYTWSSSRGGIISTNAIGNSMTVIYPSGSGNLVDTITVVATNAYGSDTVSKMLCVVDCTPASSLPWTEDFQGGDICWYKPEGSKWHDAISNGMASQEHLRHLYLQARTDTLGSWIMSKEIQIPADTTLATHLFWNVASSNNTYQHLYSVLVTTAQDYTDTANYTVLYTDNSTHVNFSNYDIRSVDLSSYAGQSIHVAFHNHAWHLAPSATGLYIDNVEIRPAPVPVVSLLAPNPTNSHEPVTFTANLIEGSSTGLTYTWHSTLMDSTTVTTAPVLTMTYTAGGTDTMMVIASNAYGADTATATVSVNSCIVSLPYEETFDGVTSVAYNAANGTIPNCWLRHWNGSNANYTPHVIGNYLNRSFIHNYTQVNPALLLMAGTNNGFDSVAVVESPWFQAPLNDQVLSFYYQQESLTQGILSVGYIQDGVFVSVADMEPQATGRTDTVSLRAFPTDVHRFALRWKQDIVSWYGVIVDNIRVFASDSMPNVCLAAPATVFVGDSVRFTARLSNGQPDSLVYTWHSAMLNQWTMDSSQLSVVYTTEGIDTITVVATTVYGADTAWAAVTINPPLPVVDTLTVTSTSLLSHDEAPIHVMYADYGFLVEFIYPARMLDGIENSTIRGVQFHSNDQLQVFDETFTLSIQEVADSTCTATGWRHDSTALQVWTGSIVVENGLWTVWFDTPYTYGGGHLLFRSTTDGLTGGNYGGSGFLCINTGDTACRYQLANAQHQLQGSCHTIPYLPAIDFFYNLDSNFCHHPLHLAVDSVWTTGATMSWDSMPGAIGYRWTLTNGGQTVISGNTTATTVNVGGITPFDTYTFSVSTICDSSNVSEATSVTFCNCSGATLPYVEDFESVTAIGWNTTGVSYLPPCWEASYDGTNANIHQPSVVSYYLYMTDLPNNPLLMIAGSNSSGFGYVPWVQAELPLFNEPLSSLALALDYRFEDATRGSLLVGYYDDGTDMFYDVDTITPHSGSYLRDTVYFDAVNAPIGTHMALRWTNTVAFYGVAIDNIEVFVDSTLIPLTPDTVWRTVTVHMLLDNGDTLFEADVVSVTGAGSYPDSTLVTLTAYYDNYYPYFWYWVTPANDTLYDNPYSFVVTSDTVINAIFGPMCVGIDGTEGVAPDVAIHPNPATGDAYVSVGVPSTVTVVDLQGRTVLQPTRVASTLCIQQGTLPKGIYFVSVSNSVGTVVKKLVIQ